MFVINYNSNMPMIKNVFKRISTDYNDAKISAELDAQKFILDTYGKPFPYLIDVTPVKNSINGLTNWKAEIIVFEREIDRDIHVLCKDEVYIAFKNHKN